jgi:hypothetical protein
VRDEGHVRVRGERGWLCSCSPVRACKLVLYVALSVNLIIPDPGQGPRFKHMHRSNEYLVSVFEVGSAPLAVSAHLNSISGQCAALSPTRPHVLVIY